MLRTFCSLACTTLVSLAAVLSPAASANPIEVSVWHALPQASSQVFAELVERYNQSQAGVRVVPLPHTSPEVLAEAARQHLGQSGGPSLIQLADVDSGEFLRLEQGVEPLHRLITRYPIEDQRWFLPQATNFMRNGRGQLMAFPFMAQAPMMFINREAFLAAGLDPDRPARTWRDLQPQLIALQKAGWDCPYASSWQSWIHLENLAAIHNQPWASRNNGFEGPGAELLSSRILHVRHVSLMMSWVRSRLFVETSSGPEADLAFAQGRCAVLTSGSGAFAAIRGSGQGQVQVTVAPLPFYDEEAATPSNPFIGGSSLWVGSGQTPEQLQAISAFLSWLSTPVVAAEWHQRTGYLPLTESAWRASDVSFYASIPGAQPLVQALSNPSGNYTRGFRLRDYARVRAVLNTELDHVWAGRKPPMLALQDANREANVIMGAVVAPAAGTAAPTAAPRPAAQQPATRP